MYSSQAISPVEQATIKDQLFQLTGRVGLLQGMIVPFKDKLQFLDEVHTVSERADTLADRISRVEATILDLNWTMTNLLSHLFMGTPFMNHSRPPAGSGVSFTQQISTESVPLISDALIVGGQGNSSEASHNNAAFVNAISTGVDIVDETSLKWSNDSNNSPSSLFQPDAGFLNALNMSQSSLESEAEPVLPPESIGWEVQNNTISRNLDDLFILGF